MAFAICLVLALSVGYCLSQIHLGPIDAYLTCYSCGIKPFPLCLNTPITCGPGEVCSVTYSDTKDTHEIQCKNAQACLDETKHYDRLCTGGGVSVNGGCQRCCETNDCVKDITNLMHQVVDPGIFCPGQCSVRDTAGCLPNGTRCFKEEFCRIDVSESFHISGTCKPNSEWQNCHVDYERQPCWIPSYPVDHMNKCVLDCCNTSSCLANYFGPHLGSFDLTVTSTARTTTVKLEEKFSCYESCSHCQTVLKPATECPDKLCMMTVEDFNGGGRSITRNCSNEALCNELWLKNSRKNPKCIDYLIDSSVVHFEDVTCNYCCNTNMCNSNVTLENLYLGV